MKPLTDEEFEYAKTTFDEYHALPNQIIHSLFATVDDLRAKLMKSAMVAYDLKMESKKLKEERNEFSRALNRSPHRTNWMLMKENKKLKEENEKMKAGVQKL